jgi:GH15 family glucan-1,4-alpha-glucosidase
VRIGNAAYEQSQIDVFGEIGDAMLQTLKAGMAPSERGRALRPVVLEYLSKAWREPDAGIWEVRGGPRHFVHSKVMAWVAFDRAASSVAAEGPSEEAPRWREIANEIHGEVCERGFDRELNSFGAHRRWKVAPRAHSVPKLVEISPQVGTKLLDRADYQISGELQ